MNAPLAEFLEQDHERLEGLLEAALESPDAYRQFRHGLLRHIAIEEKVLFPLLREHEELRERVAVLRQQHGALGALVVPKITQSIVRAIKDIFSLHNPLEEGPDGAYALAEQLALRSGKDLLARAKEIGEVPLSPAMDKLTDMGPVARALSRAGFDPEQYFSL
jgi:hypothetical protein